MIERVINIKGKNYRMVSDRVRQFRDSEAYEGWCIHTEMIHFDGKNIILKAQILNPDGMVISEGVASETIGSNYINETSAVENCQTSAVGRALAFLDSELMGDSLPSAEELDGALKGQELIKGKVDTICTTISLMRNEEELRALWESNNSSWRNDFGSNSFKKIEKAKNDTKMKLSKMESVAA